MRRPTERAATWPAGRAIRAPVLAAVLAASCAPPQDAPRPNVLWVVWDTVRADRMSLYGHERRTTPELERWAEGARVFEDCLAPASSTVASHASMFTGLYPSEHGADFRTRHLDGRFATIAELVRDAGYRTFLFSSNPNIASEENFHQGFEVEVHPWDPPWRSLAVEHLRAKLDPAERGPVAAAAAAGELEAADLKSAGGVATDALLDFLGKLGEGERWFAFVNWMEAHWSPLPPRELRERFLSPEEVARSYAIRADPIEGTFDRVEVLRYAPGLIECSELDRRVLAGTYDACIAELDRAFADLLARLEATGRLEDTLVILTSDHGEHLGERDLFDHRYSLFQPLLSVPLVLRHPELVEPGRDPRPVMTQDLFATLVALTGAAAPAGAGRRSVDLLAPERDRTRFAEYPADFRPPDALLEHYPDYDPSPFLRRLRAVVDGERKLILAGDGEARLFDLAADPGETRDLAAERRAELGAMRRAMEGVVEGLARFRPERRGGGAALEEQLRRLGYVELGDGEGGAR